MISLAQEKFTTKQTMKGRKMPITAIGAFISLIAVSLVSTLDVGTGDAAPIFDKSGLDILCKEPDTYTGCQNGVSRCIPDDPSQPTIVCDCKTDKCTTETTPSQSSNPNRTPINNLITLKELQILDSKLSNLSSQVSSLLTGQSTLANQVGDLQALCSLSDLVPLARPLLTGPLQTLGDPVDVCQRDEQGRLIFRVHNQGGVDAPASTTRVFFRCADATKCTSSQVDLPTPAIPGFTEHPMDPVPIPSSCFNTDTNKCEFAIGVDVGEVVTEANETNNTAVGVCGPSFL